MPWARGPATIALVVSPQFSDVALYGHWEAILYPELLGKAKTIFNFLVPGFWPNPAPGGLPLDSDRRDAELAGVFAPVAFLTVSFVPESRFWNSVEKT